MSEGRELIGKVFPVLDDGHVILMDYMGDDQSIVDAARISFGKGTRKVSEDRDLIRYLYRHHHATPFEMVEIKLRVRVPMDCWRQWIRHRTANVNEYSTRYSDAIDSAQLTPPDGWRAQARDNKQGSGPGTIDWPSSEIADAVADAFGEAATPGGYLSTREEALHKLARAVYKERLAAGVAREQARKDLPLSTYTEAIWKCDLRNVLHFLSLRMDPHAQHEIQKYANVIGDEIVARLFPITWQAFLDYTLNTVTLSALDIQVIHDASPPATSWPTLDHIVNQRERRECESKLIQLGLLKGGLP